MEVLLVVLPALGIAAWLASQFIRKGQRERGVSAFLSITILPLLAWYLVHWLKQDTELFEALPSTFYDVIDSLCMVAVFAWLCVRWARKSQDLDHFEGHSQRQAGPAPPQVSPTQQNPPNPLRDRLLALEELKREGLLSEEEYQQRRSEILRSI